MDPMANPQDAGPPCAVIERDGGAVDIWAEVILMNFTLSWSNSQPNQIQVIPSTHFRSFQNFWKLFSWRYLVLLATCPDQPVGFRDFSGSWPSLCSTSRACEEMPSAWWQR